MWRRRATLIAPEKRGLKQIGDDGVGFLDFAAVIALKEKRA